MHESGGVSEKAVEAAARARFDHAGSNGYWDFRIDPTEKETVKDDARRMLAAALPQLEAEWRESLLSDEAIHQLTGAIVRQADGEVISLAYDNVRNCVEGVLDHIAATRAEEPEAEQKGEGR